MALKKLFRAIQRKRKLENQNPSYSTGLKSFVPMMQTVLTMGKKSRGMNTMEQLPTVPGYVNFSPFFFFVMFLILVAENQVSRRSDCTRNIFFMFNMLIVSRV